MDTMHTLASLRKRSGLTQGEAAARLGISRETLVKYEGNSSKMPAALLEWASEFYLCPIGSIFIGDAGELAASIRDAGEGADTDALLR